MKNGKPDPLEQAKIILAPRWRFNNDVATKWASKVLKCPIHRVDDVKFDDLFDITEEDIYRFVLEHGWDEETVRTVENLPNPNEVGLEWLILPKKDDRWTLARFGSFDRNLWNKWDFASEEERTRFIIHDLFERERSRWGPQQIIEVPNYSPPTENTGGSLLERLKKWFQRKP